MEILQVYGSPWAFSGAGGIVGSLELNKKRTVYNCKNYGSIEGKYARRNCRKSIWEKR